MKKIFTVLFLNSTILLIAQEKAVNTNYTMAIPAGYYSTATGNGYVLKTQLSNIITNN
jgi:hypothetical protein